MSIDLHAQLRAARRAHQRAEASLAVLLFELKSTGRYTERGHATVESYADAELDLSVRQTRDLVAIGKHMRELPALAKAFSDGRLSATKAREVARVATPETDAAWTERACASTSRVLERQVAAARRGDTPPDDPAALPGSPRVTLRFDLSAADAEVVRATLARLRLQGGFGTDCDDGVLLADLARNALDAMEQAPGTDTPPRRSVSGSPSTTARPVKTLTWVIHRRPGQSNTRTSPAPSATRRSSTSPRPRRGSRMPSRRRRGARCSNSTTIAAPCRIVATGCGSTCITSGRGTRAATTGRPTSCRFAAPTIA
jgi:hypothetical protein